MTPLKFPAAPALNATFPLPARPGMPVWRWNGELWEIAAPVAGGSGVEEAPFDSVLYGRKDGVWTEVPPPIQYREVALTDSANTVEITAADNGFTIGVDASALQTQNGSVVLPDGVTLPQNFSVTLRRVGSVVSQVWVNAIVGSTIDEVARGWQLRSPGDGATLIKRNDTKWITTAVHFAPYFITFINSLSFDVANYAPLGCVGVIVHCVGGGGGGGGAGAWPGTSGSGGGYTRIPIAVARFTAAVAITIGAGGATIGGGGQAAGNGGTTSFGTFASAPGGLGGFGANGGPLSGRVGGTQGVGGALNLPGGGSSSITSATETSHAGMAGFGFGANTPRENTPGPYYGGGGIGGIGNLHPLGPQNPHVGASGCVVVEFW